MDDTFSFDAPMSANFAESVESFGETENFFSVPHLQRHERGGRRKSAQNAKSAIRRQALANQRKKKILENSEPESLEEAGRDQAPTKRRKIQAAPKTAATMPKSPSFMSRKKPEKDRKKTEEKSKKENLSEFYKNFPKWHNLKLHRKTTVVQPFNFMIREEKREKEKREKREKAKREMEKAQSDEEITFRQPIRKRTKSRAKSMSNAVFNRLAKPKVPAKPKELKEIPPKPEPRQKADLAKILAPPKEQKRKKWEPTKPITPHFRVDKRASERKVLQEQNAAQAKK